MKIKVKYVTNLPLEIGSPQVYFYPEDKNEKSINYKVRFINTKTNRFFEYYKENKNIITGPFQYYGKWVTEVIDHRERVIFKEYFNPRGKVIFIKMDAKALGDNLAWIPYVEEFRKIHNCKVICSTFWNELFIEEYPDIMFVAPNTRIENVYAQYYIGTHDKSHPQYQPSTYLNTPLQFIAADILGLPRKKLKAKVSQPKTFKNPKKICISEFASLEIKQWNNQEGWQEIVNKLEELGYEVVVISKERTKLHNVIDKTGDLPLSNRIKDLSEASYFIGCSSGLAWLAHSCGCHVFLISDFTSPDHEFEENITRIYGDDVRKTIEYTPIKNPVKKEKVIEQIFNKLKEFSNIYN